MCSGSKLLFMRCRRDTRLRAGSPAANGDQRREGDDNAANQYGCGAGVLGGESPVTAARRRRRRTEREHDRQPVQPGEVPGRDQPQLGRDDDACRDGGDRLRSEQSERHDELGEVITRDLDSVQRLGQPVEEPAQRTRHRLRLVVVVQTRQIAPALVAAHLDQPGAELDAEEQPPGCHQHCPGWCDVVVAEEHRQEARFEEQGLPAERVPELPDVDDGQICRPQQQPQRHRRPERHRIPEAQHHRGGQRRARPADHGEEAVRVVQLEDTRCRPERVRAQERGDRQHAAGAEQPLELQGGSGEGDDVDGRDASLQEPCGPGVIGCNQPVHDVPSARERVPTAPPGKPSGFSLAIAGSPVRLRRRPVDPASDPDDSA